MNKTNNGSHYGLTQYRWPLDFELAGRTLTLTAESASYRLAFLDREFAELDGVLSQYQALKLDSEVHFVVFGETLSVAVLDLGNGTAALRPDGAETYTFCRIEGFGDGSAPLPALTEEMAGTHVRWNFGVNRFVEHEYLADGTCRSVWSPRTDRSRTQSAAYIRLSEGKYLVEVEGTAPFFTDLPQGFSRLILAQDYEHLLTVGCIYSPTLNAFRMVSAYATEP